MKINQYSKLQTELRKHSDARKKTDRGDPRYKKGTERPAASSSRNDQRSPETSSTDA